MAAVAALTAAYAAVYSFVCVVKYRFYLYTDFDLAIFVQATDQALRGSLFSSIRGMNWLGDHQSLILFVIAPLYALVRHPLTLLVVQSVVLALGAWPVFALARRLLGHDGIAVGLAALYLLHPAIGLTNVFEFHPEVLATTTLLATMASLTAGRLGATVAFATLSVLCKEDVALVVGALGLWALLAGGRRPAGWALLAVAAGSLALSFAVLRPALTSGAAEYGRMYRDWGGSPGEVALALLRDPLRGIAAFFSTPGSDHDTLLKRLYWPQMLGPLLFLPLLAPLALAVALPVLAEHFLSFRPQQHGLIYQYTALVTPVFVFAAVRGFANLLRAVNGGRPLAPGTLAAPGRPRTMAFAVLAAALAAAATANLLYGALLRREGPWIQPLPEANAPDARDRVLRPYRDRMVARVPDEGGVVAAFEFLARLAARPAVHSLHHLYTGYHTFSTEPYPMPDGIHALLADFGDARLARYVKPGTPVRLRTLVDGNRLSPVDAAGDLLLLLRDPPDTLDLFRTDPPPPPGPLPRAVTWDGQLRLEGAALPGPRVAAGGLLAVETWWRRVAAADRHYMVHLVVEDAHDEVVFAVVRHLGYLLYPVAAWPADAPVRERYRLVIPGTLPPGEYRLGLRVAWWREGPESLATPDDTTLAARRLLVDLGRFTVASGGP